MENRFTLMIVAGEASGDTHAAKLVRELRNIPGLHVNIFGGAGPEMRAAGVESIVDADQLSIVGIPEIARSLPMFLKAFYKLKKAAIERKADAVILVDFPDFNLKLAKSLKKRGLKVIYYISPQLWAWRKYRLRIIRRYVDLVITILPFEKAWYAENAVTHVEYVGSPLAREIHSDVGKPEFCEKHALDPRRPIVALFPGSRHKEIVRILPLMLAAAGQLKKAMPDLQLVVGLAGSRDLGEVAEAKAAAARFGEVPAAIEVVSGEAYDLLNAADVAAVASGTATLEAGIIGTPMVIVYRTSAFNYKLLRPLISVEHFGLINLIAGERVAKELIQADFTPEALSEELMRLLRSEENAGMRRKLKDAAHRLGHGGASRRAAEAVLRILHEN